MIIGVDAGMLGVTDRRLKVGVWRVAVNLLKELGRLDRQNTYRLYGFAPIEPELLASFGPRMKNIVLHPTRGWFTLRLPLELKLRSVDIFLGLSQALPPRWQKNIGFVYDLGFLHSPKAYLGSQKRLARQTQDLIKRADKIVTISQSSKEDLVKQYRLNPELISVAYPGVDSRFTAQGERFKSGNPYFLFVGALKPGKNLPTALRALAQLLKKGASYEFLVVGGDYWLDPEIKTVLKELNLIKQVHLLGYVPDSDLPKYYRGAMALIVPSLWEGFCLPVAEAMACGCPIISANTSVFPEIVGSGGLLVDPRDISALAQAMEKLATTAKLRQELSSKALKSAKRFRWPPFAQTVYELLNQV
ncbi:MAG: glycosyltransferase family 4 protein [Patescibacteria group bacterium]